ncbi:MAG: hypothetical protein Q8Q09_02215 [Deltaproteobacteria bacterium]|nr:hypothetical protein [Deltaproteobacteria bacterium]
MTAQRKSAIWLGYLLSFSLASACADKPLESRHKVTSPRILAMIAEPPEARPGESIAVRVVTGGTQSDPPNFTWYFCARAEGTTNFVAQSTFGQAEPNDACFGDAGANVVRLPFRGDTAVVTIPADLLAQIEALRAVYGNGLSAAALQTIVRTAGLPLTLAVEMRAANGDGGVTVERALKRVVVVDRAARNHNPPGPSFRFGVGPDGGPGGVPMRYVPMTDPERCEPADNAGPLRVRPSEVVELAPDPTEDPWLEDYTILDSAGRVAQTRETAFYSFYSTGGSYRDDRTRIPTRNTLWEAPQRLGDITHWMVVRDGRGGTSACRYTLTVTRDGGGLDQRDAAAMGDSASDARTDVSAMDASVPMDAR